MYKTLALAHDSHNFSFNVIHADKLMAVQLNMNTVFFCFVVVFVFMFMPRTQNLMSKGYYHEYGLIVIT